MDYNIYDSKIINYNNISHIKEKVIIMVKDINSILDKHLWDQQNCLSGFLLNRINGRTIMYDHTKGYVSHVKKKAECSIGKIKNAPYNDYIKAKIDITTNKTDMCHCKTMASILDCGYCKDIINNIVTRSCGEYYDEKNIPKWNMTFATGGLRSRYRTFYGSYKLKLKTYLVDDCIAKMSFSSISDRDPVLGDPQLFQEFTLIFKCEYKKKIFLHLKSQGGELQTVPITIDIFDFDCSCYNNYEIIWNSNKIVLFVNKTLVYQTAEGDVLPALPGYTHFGVFPTPTTDSYQLLKNINSGCAPNINIKQYEYIKDISEL